jgi:hypothetical protein
MPEPVTSPRGEDMLSVGSRISWGAITAGVFVALALQFLLTILGSAVGLSLSDRVEPANLRTGALIWTIIVTCTAVFVGGMVTSQFTVGENKLEAMLYGIIMWALLLALLLGLGAAGSRVGTLVSMADIAQTASAQRQGQPPRPAASSEATTRITWFAFAGTWLSMFAAAGGALVGAGPTFRDVAVGSGERGVMT